MPVLAFRAQAESAAWERERLQHPASRVVDWEGSSHFLHQERPEELNAVVAGWLRGLG
ncbi:MAG: hypothetical protein U5Q44_11960 [Dehalococcoidia bacterium]|nr:hypothetical protein [Dehalococcoidia bacterium]